MHSANTLETAISEKQQPKLDCLSEAFVHLVPHANVNTNQIFAVAGAIDAAALTRAVAKAISGIPLMHTQPNLRSSTIAQRSASQNQLVWQHSFADDCDLNNPALRKILMDFSFSRRIDWRERPPIQVLLVSGKNAASSCVYISTHHSVADARSDCLLTEAIMRQYAQEMGHRASTEAPAQLPFHPLQQIRPDWFSPLAIAKRWMRATYHVTLDFFTRFDRGMKVPYSGSRWECSSSNPDIGRFDFYHSMIPQELEAKLKKASQVAGVTINTILTSALARTLEKSQGNSDGTLRITCAVSLRRLADPVYDKTFRNYLVASAVRVKAGLATRKLLGHIQSSIQELRSETGLLTELGRLELLVNTLRIRSLMRLSMTLINRALGTNACYSNPGIIAEDFSSFGSPENKTIQYIGFGCIIPPYDFILYTPTVNGRMQLDLVYRKECFANIQTSFVDVFNASLVEIINEVLSERAAT